LLDQKEKALHPQVNSSGQYNRQKFRQVFQKSLAQKEKHVELPLVGKSSEKDDAEGEGER
jgi:hypothetical protein